MPDQDNHRQRWKSLILVLLAFACGFLLFNFQYIMQISHIHISLAQHHKTTAFCAFTGCKLNDVLSDKPVSSSNVAAEPATVSQQQQQSGSTSEDTPPADSQLAEVQRKMESRVCGSPAVDGYAHVVPKCLEDSPTAIWWNNYYAAGGKQKDLIAHIEPAADFDGLAVYWGIGNKKNSAEECAEHCKNHLPNVVPGPFTKLPCNAFAYCSEDICFEPDAHKHTKGDCWLKFTEGPARPEVNMRGVLPDDYRKRHPNAPEKVQWIAGVLLPPGVQLTNGTWGPRWSW